MNRYIDAELLLTDNTYEWFDDWGNYTSAGQAIVDAPTADVVEVVHGRWVEKEKYTFGIMYDCSLCENRILDNGHPWNYCPNCGAKMDKEEEQ